MSHRISLLGVVLFGITLLAAQPSAAYPGSLNLIPCADFTGAHNVRIAYETDGSRQPFSNGNQQYFYTEFGIGDRFEAGVDYCELGATTYKLYNAKCLVLGESRRMPSLAVGTWNVGDTSKPAYYLIGCRTLGALRLHAGCQTQGSQTSVLAGTDWKIGGTLTALADYQSGAGLFHTLGLYWQATPTMAATLYYCRGNTPELRGELDYVGLNLQYTFSVK